MDKNIYYICFYITHNLMGKNNYKMLSSSEKSSSMSEESDGSSSSHAKGDNSTHTICQKDDFHMNDENDDILGSMGFIVSRLSSITTEMSSELSKQSKFNKNF